MDVIALDVPARPLERRIVSNDVPTLPPDPPGPAEVPTRAKPVCGRPLAVTGRYAAAVEELEELEEVAP